MKQKPIVFSLIQEQSFVMTIIMSVLTFLSVLALGLALSIGTGVIKWNKQWNTVATVQTLDKTKTDSIEKIFKQNSDEIKSLHKLSESETTALIRPWVSGGSALQDYLPIMWEIEFTDSSSMKKIGDQISSIARFMPHADALQNQTRTGWNLVLISGFVLLIILGSIGICILYITQNTAILHKRELEILNQIGASDSFVARQMQMIVAKIALRACGIGFCAACPILWIILGIAHNARMGLMSMMTITGFGWISLIILPIIIVICSIIITKKTTIKILNNN